MKPTTYTYPEPSSKIEENQALLSQDKYEDEGPTFQGEQASANSSDAKALHRRRRIHQGLAGGLLLALVLAYGGYFYGATCPFMKPDQTKPNRIDRDLVRSNGTHEFKNTVIMVSIDGLAANYLDRGLTPHLLDISKKGLRAKYMRPIFPTLTFPNHWSLMTGLHAESHGIVGNNFWDPASLSEFHYNQVKSCWNASWWYGEPIWETAENNDIITANLMWPGPPQTRTGAASTYFLPWRDKVPMHEKHDQIMSWIDLPFEERPQLILAYEPSLDQAGHAHGPLSKPVNDTLLAVDRFAKDLHDSLEARNLSKIVDIVFVSDHGMTDTSHPTPIYVDDIIGEEGMATIEHNDGWPSMGLRFHPTVNASYYLDLLLTAAEEYNHVFDVYTHETMPERYHFSHNERIAPIYVVPKVGYLLTDHIENGAGMSKGNHGYDNREPAMHAMFVAHGPFSSVLKLMQQGNVQAQGWHSTSDDTYVMEGFANVEIYNLVTKLLGIEDKAAPNNGTAGFWDKYF